MRKIRLSGREVSIIRVIGFGMGVSGQELLEASSYDPEQLVDMLNGMMNAGFIVTTPFLLEIDEAQLRSVQFEINSGYVQELRKALPARF